MRGVIIYQQAVPPFAPGVQGTAAPETNVDYIAGYQTPYKARYQPAKYTLLASLWQNSDIEPPAAETNPHFVGRFVPARYFNFRYNFRDDVEPPAVETNPHFIARYTPVRLNVPLALRDNAELPPVPETNVHFIATFKPVRYTIFRFNFEGCDESAPLPPGAGKRRDFPSYIPQPPYDVKPNKPFQPIWDKRRQEEQERAKALAELPPAPVPLPPAALFERQTDAQALGLPELDHGIHPEQLEPGLRDAQDLSDLAGALQAFAQRAEPAPDTMSQSPASHDAEEPDVAPSRPRIVVPLAHDLGQRMRDARDLSDAMALMRAMGLIED